MNFDSKPNNSTEWFSFDMVRQLATGETITGTPTFTVTVVSGTDPSPSSMLSGSGVVNGTVISQKLTGGVSGAAYKLTASCTTSNGQTLSEHALFYVE